MSVLRPALAGLFLSTSAAAQGAICPGLDAVGQWAGGSEEASDIATAEAPLDTLTLVPLNSQAVSQFTLTAPAEIRVEAAAQGDGDPLIELRDAAGTVLAQDDDSGGNRAARAELSLDPGTYCLAAGSFDGAMMMTQIRISRTEQEALTEGLVTGGDRTCGPETEAVPLADGAIDAILAEGVSQTAPIAETMFYRFALDTAQAVTLSAVGEDADPVLTLYDYDGAVLAENDDDESSLNSRIDMVDGLQPGSYCLGLEALSDENAPVTVAITTYDPEAVRLGQYARGEVAPPLDGSYPVTELGTPPGRSVFEVTLRDEAIWYSLEIDAPGLILAEAVGAGNADPKLIMFDDLGRALAENDDARPDSYDSLIAARVQPGTYTLGISPAAGGTGDVRLLIERYARTE